MQDHYYAARIARPNETRKFSRQHNVSHDLLLEIMSGLPLPRYERVGTMSLHLDQNNGTDEFRFFLRSPIEAFQLV